MDKNFIYSKLVRDDDDIIGMVAYGIYKKHKIEFIESIKKEYKREPNDEEWHAFALSTNTGSQLNKYISQADATLASFVMNSAGEQIKSAERQMLEQYQANIKAVLPSNWKTVGLSVLGSLIFSAVITLALILGAFSEKDKANLVNKMIEEQKAQIEPINTNQN
ncbi:MAG: hypothetical protein NC342_00190 [Pseudoflavonifractor sp.]|nr:hypothetical protein [Alloprevotella sp.]MCM1115946.1 hypothetical protein [Pseudoflavonifractor sp.]